MCTEKLCIRGMAQQVKFLLQKHKDLYLDHRTHVKFKSVHSCNFNFSLGWKGDVGEGETGETLGVVGQLA